MWAYFWYATPQYIYYVLPRCGAPRPLVTIGLLTRTASVVMKAAGSACTGRAAEGGGALIAGGVLFLLEETVLGRPTVARKRFAT